MFWRCFLTKQIGADQAATASGGLACGGLWLCASCDFIHEKRWLEVWELQTSRNHPTVSYSFAATLAQSTSTDLKPHVLSISSEIWTS
ncbi:hypothetical protein BDV27DRAFT_72057 [Aspergillus caelatus]|uniref:Uncharacterized protein n=1 Tax=Aspergillus caelatus TaxID=61420 RepID=A0A5N7AEB8_9EURO|nr:uncharacterized protein BDV27DRAFT_72057 [Aspergillus caelatus]KAE8367506.1 hypothetical protein BDV27DRAFT_72057 [Aspergillus caelatus]